MKNSLRIILVGIAAAMVLAAATSAYAAGSGTVYGQATMQPTVSIVLSGVGSDSQNPLVYEGRANQGYMPNGEARVTVTNSGEQTVPILLGYGSDPTDGSDTWPISDMPGLSNCIWLFYGDLGGTNVPGSNGSPRELVPALLPGEWRNFNSTFYFPETFNGSPHTMTALLIAGS